MNLSHATTITLICFIAGCATNPNVTATDASRLPAVRSVQTDGTATIYAKPDEVNYRFSVRTQDRELAKAKADNDAACKQIVAFVKSLRVEDKDVQTQTVRSDREYEDRPDRHREFVGYSVTREYTMKLSDVSKLEALSDALVSNSSCTNQSFSYSLSRSRELRDRARKDAIKAAREKAELLARELGCRLGAPSNVSERTSWNFGGGSGGNSNTHDLDGDGDAGQLITSPGQLGASASVDVTFDLIPQ